MIDPAEVDSAMKRWRASPEFRQYCEAMLHAFKEGPGARALEYLEQLFDGNTYAQGDPHHMAYLAGRRSVLMHIRALRLVAAEPPKEITNAR